MTAALGVKRTAPWSRALRAESMVALATPMARTMLGGSVIMAIVSCAANLAVLDSLQGEKPVRVALHSGTVPALVFALVAGAYASSTDRRSRFIDQRLLTDPSRLRWLRAKVTVHTALGIGYGVLGMVSALATSSVEFTLRGTPLDLTSTVVARSLAGVLLASGMFGLIGAAIGSMTANTTAALAGLLVWVLVVEPPAVLGLPELGRYLPASAGLALTYSPDAELLSQVVGGITLATYAALAVALAIHKLARADL
jgi:ABC-2 type transport system permease protein